MRKQLESDWKSTPKGSLKTYHKRLRKLVIRSLADLTLVAEREKEDQLAQMFTIDTLRPLLNALTETDPKERTERHYEIAKLMLRIAYDKLSPRIASEYRPSIMGTLDANILLLESLPTAPKLSEGKSETNNPKMPKKRNPNSSNKHQ
jgi:hypothetical protein